MHEVQSLGLRVREGRRTLGLTQGQLAEQAGTGIRFVSELERGKETVELGKVMLVLKVLGLNLVPSGDGTRAHNENPALPVAGTEPPASPRPGNRDRDTAPQADRPAAGGDAARLWDMRQAATELQALLAVSATDAEPMDGFIVCRAVERCAEILGEAARRVSPATQARWRDIPWRTLVARRNQLVMEYEKIQFDELVSGLRADVPGLIARLTAAAAAGAPGA